MLGAVRTEAGRALGHPRAPLVALAMILLLSLPFRGFHLGSPCGSPCRTRTDHTLIFDEAYYVNAARVIAGVKPPEGVPYANAPLHKDPNAEHPQLAKLLIAGSIELFGDGPLAWRLGSLLFGTLAILGTFLVRSGILNSIGCDLPSAKATALPFNSAR